METAGYRWVRNARLAACAAAALALPSGAEAATATATVKASVVKPLILTSTQAMDFGTIILSGAGTWSGATMRISQTGAVTCSANLTCSGTPKGALYNVSGTNNRVVLVSAPNVILTNQSDATQKLTLVTDAPSSLTLANSGPPGTNFGIGGTLTLGSATAGGTYSGTMTVTVDYQ
jgi:spore coat protein U-like protein